MGQPKNKKLQSGYILVFFLLVTGLILMLAMAALAFQGGVLRQAKNSSFRQAAAYLAEAGLEKGFKSFQTDPAGYTGETLTLGDGTAVISISPGPVPNERILTSTGQVAGQTRRYRTKIVTAPNGAAIAFKYGLQAGDLGVTMGNNTTINGNIYSNANIVGGNGSTVTGDAYAVGTISKVTVNGQKVNGADPAPLPPYDPAFWKERAKTGGTINGNYLPPTGSTLGPLYITGDLNIDNNVVINFAGPVYVEGKVVFGNGPILNVDNSIANQSVLLISNGDIAFGNSIIINKNQSGGYLFIVSNSATSSAITIGNTANTINAPLYAPFGRLVIGNKASAVSFSAKGIDFGNEVTINYDEGLANTNFTTGPGGSWTMQKGSFQEY